MADQDKEQEQGEIYEAETDETSDYDEEVNDQSFSQKYRALFGWAILGILFMGFGIYQLMVLFGGGGAKEGQTTKKVVVPIVKSQTQMQGKTTPAPTATITPIAPISSNAPMQPSSSSMPTMPTTFPQNRVITTPSPAPANVLPQQNVPVPPTVTRASTPTMQVPAPQIAPVSPPAAKTPPMVVSAPTPKEMPAAIASSAGLADRMQRLEKSIAEHQQTLVGQKIINPEQLRKIENDIAHMKTELGQIKDMLSQGTMHTKTKRLLHAKKGVVKKAVTESKNVLPAGVVQSEMVTAYYVKAIVPSRAWLQAMDGSTISVGVGDTIPGYGMVTKIDVNHGRVVTDSGQVIPFGINAE